MKVVQIPTAKNINYCQNKPFRDIKMVFERHRQAINVSKLLIYLLIISNFVSWIFIAGLTNAFIQHDHNIQITTDYSVPNLPPIEELK